MQQFHTDGCIEACSLPEGPQKEIPFTSVIPHEFTPEVKQNQELL
jgi:hypothetical protein